MLSNWKCQDLTFFAGGEFVEATQFFMRIRTALKRVVVKSGSKSFTLQPSAVSVPGFQSDSLLYSTINQQFCKYSLLTEYFMFPEKFLFYKLSGLGPVSAFGESTDFELQFVLTSQKEQISLKKEFFTLSAVPVVNLFSMDAEPVQVDHTVEQMSIIPSGHQRHNYDIYTVEVGKFFPLAVEPLQLKDVEY
jgi:type VI secretion system protein ImpG